MIMVQLKRALLLSAIGIWMLGGALSGCGDGSASADTEIAPDSDGASDGSGSLDQITAETVPEDIDVAELPPPQVFFTPPEGCEPPSVLPEDPLVHLATAKAQTMITHIVDVEPDPAGDRVYAVGYPGFLVFTHSEETGQFEHVGMYPNGAWIGAMQNSAGGDVVEFDHMQTLGDHLVAVTARGVTPTVWWFKNAIETHGLFILSTEDATLPTLVSSLDLPDLADMALKDNLLHVVTYMGDLHVIDISDVLSPTLLYTMTGMGNAWKIIHVGDYAYVADALNGLITIDMSDPLEPAIVNMTAQGVGVQDIWHYKGFIYAAVGVPGVAVFDLEDPEAPKHVTNVSTGPSSVGVSAAKDVVWSANQEGVVAIDISDPYNPYEIATKDTPDWAMNVYAWQRMAYVADWDYVHTYEIDPSLKAPELDPHPEDLYFWDGSGSRNLTIKNRGAADLELTGLEAGDPRFTLEIDRVTVPPGETATVRVTFEDDGEPADTQLCIASNDPDMPQQWVRLNETSEFDSASKVGQPAPDFVLPDIHNTGLYQLSDYFGQPIYLCFFSTW
jgi:hypothetical protein